MLCHHFVIIPNTERSGKGETVRCWHRRSAAHSSWNAEWGQDVTGCDRMHEGLARLSSIWSSFHITLTRLTDKPKKKKKNLIHQRALKKIRTEDDSFYNMCTSDQEQCCLCLFSVWTWLHFHTRVAWIHSSFCILTWHTRTVQKQWEISHNHCMAHFQYNADWVHRENAHTAVQVPIFGCLDQQLHFCDCLWLNADVWAGKWCWNMCAEVDCDL